MSLENDKMPISIDADRPKTDWRSMYIVNIAAFLSSIQTSSLTSTIWPYMKLVHPAVTETTFGFMRSATALANIISSGIAGYLCNRYGNSKPFMIVGKMIGICAAILYLIIELHKAVAIPLFFAFDILQGVGMGLASVYRTYIAMNSAESERSKAFGLSLFASSLGFVCGPILQLLFTRFGYPGHKIFFGLHLNLYTAPVFLTFFTSIVGILLLFFFFKGKLHPKPKIIPQPNQNNNVLPSEVTTFAENVKFDKFAVVMLILIKISIDINMLGIQSISTAYSMTAFSWTSRQSVMYHSAFTAATGICSFFFAIGYVFFHLEKKISERICLVIALSVYLLFYLLTNPWFFISETIPYEHIQGSIAYYSQIEAKNAKAALMAANHTKNGTIEFVGCRVAYTWCQNTPKVNVYVYNIAIICVMGISHPLSQINLDVLYSKILGPIKQGNFQALFFGAGQVLSVIGPIIITSVYTKSGPRWLWVFQIITTMSSLVMFVIFYHRLIPFIQRLEKKIKKAFKPKLKFV